MHRVAEFSFLREARFCFGRLRLCLPPLVFLSTTTDDKVRFKYGSSNECTASITRFPTNASETLAIPGFCGRTRTGWFCLAVDIEISVLIPLLAMQKRLSIGSGIFGANGVEEHADWTRGLWLATSAGPSTNNAGPSTPHLVLEVVDEDVMVSSFVGYRRLNGDDYAFIDD